MSDHQVMESEGARPSNWLWALAAAVGAAVVATWLTGLPVATALLFGAAVFVVYAVVLAQFWEDPSSGDQDHGHGHDAHGHDSHNHDAHSHGSLHDTHAAPVAVDPPVAVAATGEAAKPMGLTGPRGGKADNLQEIEGIGPGLEKLANDLGIWHFDQIAAWGSAEIAWMDGNLKGFKGRVTRDKWVAQAKIIVTEGVEAFRIRAKTNNY